MRNFNWNSDQEWSKINKMDCLKWFILGGKEKCKRKDEISFAKKLSIRGGLLKLGDLS